MALINAYNGKNTSGGNTLVDMVDANNGIFGGASLPVVNANGYIQFTGGHGNTAGDWGRITFGTNFSQTAGDNFSTVVVWKSKKVDTTLHSLFWGMYQSVSSGGYYGHFILDTEVLRTYIKATATLNFAVNSIKRISKWNISTIANSQTARLIAHDSVITTDATDNSNNLFDATSMTTIGASKSGASWNYDATMDFHSLLRFNYKLSNAEISQYNNALAGVI